LARGDNGGKGQLARGANSEGRGNLNCSGAIGRGAIGREEIGRGANGRGAKHEGQLTCSISFVISEINVFQMLLTVYRFGR
jgi:hypothetical protein